MGYCPDLAPASDLPCADPTHAADSAAFESRTFQQSYARENDANTAHPRPCDGFAAVKLAAFRYLAVNMQADAPAANAGQGVLDTPPRV